MSIFIVAVLSVVMTPLFALAYWLLRKIRQRCLTECVQTASQEMYNSAWIGDEFLLDYRVCGQMFNLWLLLMFGSGEFGGVGLSRLQDSLFRVLQPHLKADNHPAPCPVINRNADALPCRCGLAECDRGGGPPCSGEAVQTAGAVRTSAAVSAAG